MEKGARVRDGVEYGAGYEYKGVAEGRSLWWWIDQYLDGGGSYTNLYKWEKMTQIEKINTHCTSISFVVWYFTGIKM